MLEKERIKDFLSHEESLIREYAVKYFSEADVETKADKSLMPAVIEGLEWYSAHGGPNLILSYASELAQTPETIEWILNRMKKKSLRNAFYQNIIVKSEPELLREFRGQM